MISRKGIVLLLDYTLGLYMYNTNGQWQMKTNGVCLYFKAAMYMNCGKRNGAIPGCNKCETTPTQHETTPTHP